MNSKHKQAGLSSLGWLFAAAVIVLVALAGMKIAPISFEYFSVRTSLASLKADERTRRAEESEIRELLMKRFQINRVENVRGRNVDVEFEGARTIVTVSYEVRKPLVGNLDIVASFNEVVEIP